MLDVTRPPPPAPVRCRQITAGDIEAVVALLVKGFPDRGVAYWRTGLARHAAQPLPPGCPAYGYMLESGGRPVGVLLTLYRAIEAEGRSRLRCNLSSWYVEPEFRAQALMLDKVAQSRKDVTYVNVSPAPHTLALQEVRGFRRYTNGMLLAVPALSAVPRDVTVRLVGPSDPLDDLEDGDRRLVRDHVGFGCVGLVAARRDVSEPLVFIKRWLRAPRSRGPRILPCFQLVYCRDPDIIPAMTGAAGRTLLRHFGVPFAIFDTNGPISGVKGRYFAGTAPKICRGPDRVRPGDLSYSELVLFGP